MKDDCETGHIAIDDQKYIPVASATPIQLGVMIASSPV